MSRAGIDLLALHFLKLPNKGNFHVEESSGSITNKPLSTMPMRLGIIRKRRRATNRGTTRRRLTMRIPHAPTLCRRRNMPITRPKRTPRNTPRSKLFREKGQSSLPLHLLKPVSEYSLGQAPLPFAPPIHAKMTRTVMCHQSMMQPRVLWNRPSLSSIPAMSAGMRLVIHMFQQFR